MTPRNDVLRAARMAGRDAFNDGAACVPGLDMEWQSLLFLLGEPNKAQTLGDLWRFGWGQAASADEEREKKGAMVQRLIDEAPKRPALSADEREIVSGWVLRAETDRRSSPRRPEVDRRSS